MVIQIDTIIPASPARLSATAVCPSVEKDGEAREGEQDQATPDGRGPGPVVGTRRSAPGPAEETCPDPASRESRPGWGNALGGSCNVIGRPPVCNTRARFFAAASPPTFICVLPPVIPVLHTTPVPRSRLHPCSRCHLPSRTMATSYWGVFAGHGGTRSLLVDDALVFAPWWFMLIEADQLVAGSTTASALVTTPR